MAQAQQQQYVLQRFPQTDLELYFWVQATWGVRIPWTRVCPGHVSPFEAFADAFFARNQVALWWGSRGFAGKSMLLSVLGLSEMVALGAFVTILGGSGAQSLRVHETMTGLWTNQMSPSYLLTREPTKFDTSLTNGGKARTLMASQKSVRGPHPSRMRLDEIDEMEMEVLEAAQGQPMRARNQQGEVINTNTVMSSTWQYPNGTMAKMIKRAEAEGYPCYQWCMYESANPIDGWLSVDEIEQKRREVPKRMFATEYELQEPSFGQRAIDTEKVDKMFSLARGFVLGDEGRYYEFDPPHEDRDYVTGADWAKAKDYTIIATFDSTQEPWKLVAFERLHRRPWPVMISRLNRRIEQYGGHVVHDSTGLGTVVEDYIVIPHHMQKKNIKGMVLAGRARNDMLTEYINAVEKELIVAPRVQFAYEEHKFATPDDLYSSSTAHHLPDTIATFALAWTRRKKRKSLPMPPMKGLTRENSPWVNVGQTVG